MITLIDQIWALPSTNSSIPVTKLESSEARNSAAFATSSGSPVRPIGTVDTIRAITSGGRRLTKGVLIGPGLTSEHFAMSLECVQLGHDRGSSQFALQCRKQPLHVVLFKVKLMCRRRGEDLKEDQLMRVALP